MKKTLAFLAVMAAAILHAQMIEHEVNNEYVIYPQVRRMQPSTFQIPSKRIPGGVTPYEFNTRLDYNTYYSMVGLMDAYYQRVLAARVFGNEMPCVVTNSWYGIDRSNNFNYTRYGASVFGGGTNGVHLSDEARDFYISPRYLLTTGYYDRVARRYHYIATGDVWQVRQNYAITNYASQVRIPGYLPWQLGNIYGGQYVYTAAGQEPAERQWEPSQLWWKIREDNTRRQACQWYRPNFATDLLKYKNDDYNYYRDLYDCYKGLTSSKIPGNLVFPPGATDSFQGGWKESALEALTGSGAESNGLGNVWIEMGRFMGWDPKIQPSEWDGQRYDDESILADVVYNSYWWGYDLDGKQYDTYLEIQKQQAEDLEDSWTNYVLNAYGWPVKPEMPPVSTRIDLGPWVWSDIFMNMIDTYFVGNGALPQPCFSNLWDSAEETAEISITGRNLAWHYEPSSNTWVVVATNSDTQVDLTVVTSIVTSTSMVADNAVYYSYSDKIRVPSVGFGWYVHNMLTNQYRVNSQVMERFYNVYSPIVSKRYYPGYITLDYDLKRMDVKFYDQPERITQIGSGYNTYSFYDEYTDSATGTVSVTWKLARQRGELVPIHRQSRLWYSKPAIYPSPAIEDTGVYEEANILYLESYSSMPAQLVDIPSEGAESSCTQQVFRCCKLQRLGGIHDIDDAFRNHWEDMISEMTQIQLEKANWTATDATPCAAKIEEVYTAAKGKDVMKKIFELTRKAERISGSISFVVPHGTYVVWNSASPTDYTVYSELPFGEYDEEHACVPVIQVFSSLGNAFDDNTSVTNSAVEWIGDAAGVFKFNFNKMKQVPEDEQ